MASLQKSLTDAPENLKEAIDWVLRVSGRDSGQDDNDAIKGLAEEVKNLLDKDAGTLAIRVDGFFRTARSGLKSADRSTAREAFILKSYLSDITHYGRPLNEKQLGHLKEALQKDVEGPGASSGGPISNLADGLKTLIGYQGNGNTPDGNSGIGCQDYESSYKSATERWNSLTPDQHRTCALTLLGIMPVLYFGLTYIYWWCTEESSSDPGWAQHKVDGSGASPPQNKQALKTFLEKVGFSDITKLNGQKTGSEIVQFINTGFKEIQIRGNDAKESYSKFLGKLQKMALESLTSNPNSNPLTSLYLLSYYYITYPLHEVQSTSPATPSFLGYSGIAALAGGAYAFNLGGLGTFMGALLA
ncbi:variant erythrocyte surface antigen-1 family protein [Babesia caballi]|uniref:Variant erythrocyte surface antigen-1 family protein n=1 Tax=Babesia caballi TaxID=5871 RepID=A0AAV4LNR4_BABCB|nr:variant erythrocyte surface antigen-1 family protein [Babesia caballi]